MTGAAEAGTESALARARAGDEEAFAELVRRHQAMVYSIAWHYLRHRDVAEEVAQDAFLHLFRSLDSLESDAHVESWLRRVAVHRSIDQTRRARYRPWAGLEQAPEPAQSSTPADPWLRDLLARLVAALPGRARMLVILRFQEGLEPAEIAALLALPVGTVKSGLHRALALLRGKISRETAARPVTEARR